MKLVGTLAEKRTKTSEIEKDKGGGSDDTEARVNIRSRIVSLREGGVASRVREQVPELKMDCLSGAKTVDNDTMASVHAQEGNGAGVRGRVVSRSAPE